MDGKKIRLQKRKNGIKNLFLFSLVFSAACSAAFSAPENPGQKREIFRYVYIVNGARLEPEINYDVISNRAFAFAFARIEWTAEGFPRRALDRIYPEFSGIFDSSQVYSASSDEGKWISSLPSGKLSFRNENDFSLSRPEEFEDGNSLLENIYKDSSLLENVPALLETSVPFPEKRLRTSEENLRLHLFETETLSLQFTDEGKVLVVSDGKTFSRKYYDFLSRLSKKENWTSGSSLGEMRLVSSETFEYAGDDVKPLFKTLESGDSVQKITYGGNGKISRVQNFKEDLLQSRTDFLYTDDGKILEQIYTEHEYSEKRPGKLARTSVKRDVYDYEAQKKLLSSSSSASQEDVFPPDYYYYEDGRLCMKTVYSGKNDWISTMYFENGFTVESSWKNGRRFKDDYYLDGKLTRSRIYGNNE